MSLLFAEKVKINSTAFIKRVKDVASILGIPPEWLMIVMNYETAGTFSPSVRNPHSSATGLIQFMAATARDLGTTTDELARMTNVQQLDYVLKYLQNVQRAHGSFNRLVDVYLAVFYPASIRQPETFVYPDRVYAVNRGFDVNGDGRITKLEIENKILATVPVEYREQVKKKY